MRLRMAEAIRALPDIEPWPELKWFNDQPCARHAPHRASPILCGQCGFRLRRYQRVGAAWMYVGLPGMLSDGTGSGKTAQVAALLAMCRENGELGVHNRAVIVCRATSTVDPWERELRRLLPGVKLLMADGDRQQRVRGYMSEWEVCVISDGTLRGARGRRNGREGDVALLEDFPVGILVYDDLDAMRNNATETAGAVNRLARRCTRVRGLHATPFQKQLWELWCQLEPCGALQRLGSLERFQMLYTGQTSKLVAVADPRDKTGRTRISQRVQVDNGITSSPAKAARYRAEVRPFVLRRTAEEMDVDMPAAQLCPVFMNLNPRQRDRYEELRAGVLRRLRDGREEVTRAEAGAAFTRGAQICSGLAALDEGEGADDSVKLDWIMGMLDGELRGEKLVAFVYFKANAAALAARCREAGIGGVLLWGAETDKRERGRRLAKFREDEACQVLIGTAAIETGVNLQVARHLAAVDTILNPARMEQLAGRIKRQGSLYKTVYVHHLLAVSTQEEAYLPLLRREGEMADVAWDEASSLFTALSPRQQMQLIARGRLAA